MTFLLIFSVIYADVGWVGRLEKVQTFADVVQRWSLCTVWGAIQKLHGQYFGSVLTTYLTILKIQPLDISQLKIHRKMNFKHCILTKFSCNRFNFLEHKKERNAQKNRESGLGDFFYLGFFITKMFFQTKQGCSRAISGYTVQMHKNTV